jgi:hypothetical protein
MTNERLEQTLARVEKLERLKALSEKYTNMSLAGYLKSKIVEELSVAERNIFYGTEAEWEAVVRGHLGTGPVVRGVPTFTSNQFIAYDSGTTTVSSSGTGSEPCTSTAMKEAIEENLREGWFGVVEGHGNHGGYTPPTQEEPRGNPKYMEKLSAARKRMYEKVYRDREGDELDKVILETSILPDEIECLYELVKMYTGDKSPNQKHLNPPRAQLSYIEEKFVELHKSTKESDSPTTQPEEDVHISNLQKAAVVCDDLGHWYVIPEELFREFNIDLEDDELCEDGKFREKWSKYRTGGEINAVQLYAEFES